MHEIICPHCNKAFKIDEAGYANILKQVRDGDFDKQLHERLELAEREKRDAIALAEAKVTNTLQSAAARKDAEIQALQAQLAASEVARKLAVTEALAAVSKERDGLENELQNEQERARNAQQAAVEVVARERDRLKNDLNQKKKKNQLEEKAIKGQYALQLRDMKARLSTKMVGETLEQHCEIEFNRIRAVGYAFGFSGCSGR